MVCVLRAAGDEWVAGIIHFFATYLRRVKNSYGTGVGSGGGGGVVKVFKILSQVKMYSHPPDKNLTFIESRTRMCNY